MQKEKNTFIKIAEGISRALVSDCKIRTGFCLKFMGRVYSGQ